jgi:hypothetical protein
MRVNQTELTTFPRRSVYDQRGENRIGDIQEHAGGYLARDRQGREIGVFDSLAAAATARWRATWSAS